MLINKQFNFMEMSIATSNVMQFKSQWINENMEIFSKDKYDKPKYFCIIGYKIISLLIQKHLNIYAYELAGNISRTVVLLI